VSDHSDRKIIKQEVAHTSVTIDDDDFGGTGSERTLGRRDHIAGHPASRLVPPGFALREFLTVNDTADSLHISRDKNPH
jgi:hypothetical protein